MKFLSMLIFSALATAAFMFIVLRPPVEGNAINLGIPASEILADSSTESNQIEVDTEKADKESQETEIPSELKPEDPKSDEPKEDASSSS